MTNEEYQCRMHDLTTGIYNNLWELRELIREDPEEIERTCEWLGYWTKLFEDELHQYDEEN